MDHPSHFLPASKFQAKTVHTPGRISAANRGGEKFGSCSPPPPLDLIIIFKALYLLRHSVPVKNQLSLHFQQA